MAIKDTLENCAVYTCLGVYALAHVAIPAIAGVVVYGWASLADDYIEARSHRKQIVAQLKPHVEKVDKKPGISFEDQLDFARKAGVSTSKVVEGETIDFDSVPVEKLEKALESYRLPNRTL